MIIKFKKKSGNTAYFTIEEETVKKAGTQSRFVDEHKRFVMDSLGISADEATKVLVDVWMACRGELGSADTYTKTKPILPQEE